MKTMTISDVDKDKILGDLIARLASRDVHDYKLTGDIFDALIGEGAPDAKRWYDSDSSILESLEEAIAFAARISPSKSDSLLLRIEQKNGVAQIEEAALRVTGDAIARHREDLYPALPGSDVLDTIAHWRNASLQNETQAAYASILAPRPDYELAALGAGFQVDQDGDWSSKTKEASYGSAEDACLDWDVAPVMKEPIMALNVPLPQAEGLRKLGQRVSHQPVPQIWTIFDLTEAKIAWWTVCRELRAKYAAKAA